MMTKAQPLMRTFILALIGLGIGCLVGLLPFPALAAPSDFQGEAVQLSTNLIILPKLIAVACYVIGTFFAAASLFALRRFIENSDDNPINVFIGLAAVSALLIMLPYSLNLTRNSIGASETSTVQSSQDQFKSPAEAAAACNKNGNIGDVFCNLIIQFSPFARFLSVISYVMAISLTLTGLLNLKDYGDDPSQTPFRSIVIKFVLAALLISLPLAMQVFVKSVTGGSVSSGGVTIQRPQLYKQSS